MLPMVGYSLYVELSIGISIPQSYVITPNHYYRLSYYNPYVQMEPHFYGRITPITRSYFTSYLCCESYQSYAYLFDQGNSERISQLLGNHLINPYLL